MLAQELLNGQAMQYVMMNAVHSRQKFTELKKFQKLNQDTKCWDTKMNRLSLSDVKKATCKSNEQSGELFHI